MLSADILALLLQETRGNAALWNGCRPNALILHDFNNRVKPATSSLERGDRAEKRRTEAERAMAERREADEAFRVNHERLKAERLARETKKS